MPVAAIGVAPSAPADIEYPQLEGPPPSLAEVSAQEPALVEAVDACLRAEPTDRPDLPALMARLEEIAGLPSHERRHAVAIRGA